MAASWFARIRTYRLALYYLAAILLAALAAAMLGKISLSPIAMVYGTALALAVCWGINAVFARVYGAASSTESVCISALILALIISPPAPGDLAASAFFALAAAWAMASKYLVAAGKRHLFNPAAFGAALMGTVFHKPVSWWVGDYPLLLPVVILGGVLILMRLRYVALLASFAVVVLGIAMAQGGGDPMTALSLMALHSMFFFFAFVMLTEPRTAPLGTWRQLVYGALVGLLFAPTTHIGRYYFTPEMALLAGNLFVFLANRRRLARWLPARA